MSMMEEIQRRQRTNPRESASNFAQAEQERMQARTPDTMSGQFQPAISNQLEPASLSERSVPEASWIQDQNVTIQREQDALLDATARAAQAVQARQQQAQQQEYQRSGGVEQAGYAYQPDGNLSESRQQLLQKTASYAGTPYQLGGRTARGIDCSGLVMSVYNSLGFDIQSHSVSGQARAIPGVKTSVSNLRPGDLVVWGDNSHIAVYAGNGQIWDASRSKGTTLRPLWAGPQQVYGIAVRLPGE